MQGSANCEIRLLHAQDLPAAIELSSLANWNQTVEDWRLLLELAPGGCFGIQADARVVGTATLLGYDKSLAWIGMVLIHPDYRRRGLATKLFRHVLACADDLGIRTLKLDATEQGEPLYAGFGFAPEQVVERWSGPPRMAKAGNIGSSMDSRSLPQVDRNAFGADRSSLLQALVQRGRCFTNATGFLLTRGGSRTGYLGPCVAKDPGSAGELFRRALETPDAEAWSWDLLRQNRNAVALATELGFAPQRRLTRMFRGKELRGNDPSVYAIAGFEFG